MLIIILVLPLLFSVVAKAQDQVVLQVRSKLVKMGYDPEKVNTLLDNHELAKPLKPFRKPLRLTWAQLEAKLLSEEWVGKGKKFLNDHSTTLEREFKNHGIPPKIITAVITIETQQGEFLGDWPALQIHYLRSLASLTGARENFTFMAKMCLDLQTADCLKIPGSRTGAIGLSQFMPASLPFAEDGNGDGVVDLFNPADAIMSVGNFLASFSSPEHMKRVKTKKAKRDPLLHSLVHYLGDKAPYQRIVLRYSKIIATNEGR